MLLRLCQWAFRIKCLPDLEWSAQTGRYEYTDKKRPPTLGEALTGISGS